ncbi:MAG TPA: HAD hydrolase-like protein [Patescibacteria group bacterium]|nr:HAD hydrolase-like protein [Patescibacteria group bacterium]
MRTIEQPVQRIETKPFKSVRFVGFDLDGTILKEPTRSFPEVFATRTSRLFHVPENTTHQFAQATMGNPTIRQLETLPNSLSLPSNHLLRLVSMDLRQFIANSIDIEFFNQPLELFPDITSALKSLKQQGIHLFISSSRPTKNIFQLLELHPELAECIDFAIGTNPNDPSLKKGEGHFQKVAEHFGIPFEELVEQSVFIGDTPSDIQAGASINIKTIGRTSTKSAEELKNAGAALTVHDFSSLPFLFASERDLSENQYERR